MKANEIIENIRENVGYNNFRNWTKREVAQWIKANYNCSTYVAKRVAKYICNICSIISIVSRL